MVIIMIIIIIIIILSTYVNISQAAFGISSCSPTLQHWADGGPRGGQALGRTGGCPRDVPPTSAIGTPLPPGFRLTSPVTPRDPFPGSRAGREERHHSETVLPRPVGSWGSTLGACRCCSRRSSGLEAGAPQTRPN